MQRRATRRPRGSRPPHKADGGQARLVSIFFLTSDYIRRIFGTVVITGIVFMSSFPQISDAEWDVMRIVWDNGPLTAGDVVRHLAGAKDWHPRTVKTLLSRLVKKGAVEMK